MNDPLAVGLGFLAFTILVLAIRAAIVYARNKTARPAVESPQAAAGRCSTTGCTYPASILVRESDDLGGDLRLVCRGCADEGSAFRWWQHVWEVA